MQHLQSRHRQEGGDRRWDVEDLRNSRALTYGAKKLHNNYHFRPQKDDWDHLAHRWPNEGDLKIDTNLADSLDRGEQITLLLDQKIANTSTTDKRSAYVETATSTSTQESRPKQRTPHERDRREVWHCKQFQVPRPQDLDHQALSNLHNKNKDLGGLSAPSFWSRINR